MNTKGFTLDINSIGNTSTNEAKIRLPYYGALPTGLDGAANATISITIRAGLTVSLVLLVGQDNKYRRYPIQATADEINHILHRFFFTGDGKTRHDTGLDRYSLGFNQSSYINWQRLAYDQHGLDNFLLKLPASTIERALQHTKHRETA